MTNLECACERGLNPYHKSDVRVRVGSVPFGSVFGRNWKPNRSYCSARFSSIFLRFFSVSVFFGSVSVRFGFFHEFFLFNLDIGGFWRWDQKRPFEVMIRKRFRSQRPSQQHSVNNHEIHKIPRCRIRSKSKNFTRTATKSRKQMKPEKKASE